MLLFGVTIPATVLQKSEIPEGPMNYPVSFFSTAAGSCEQSVNLELAKKHCFMELLVSWPDSNSHSAVDL
jgi:hypothetical protein